MDKFEALGIHLLRHSADKSKECCIKLKISRHACRRSDSRKARQRLSILESAAGGHSGPRQPLKLLDLDEEALESVLLALPPASLALAACVSQGLRKASESESLWEKQSVGRWLHPHKHLREGAASAHC